MTAILVSMLGLAISETGGTPILAAHLFILYYRRRADTERAAERGATEVA